MVLATYCVEPDSPNRRHGSHVPSVVSTTTPTNLARLDKWTSSTGNVQRTSMTLSTVRPELNTNGCIRASARLTPLISWSMQSGSLPRHSHSSVSRLTTVWSLSTTNYP